MATDQVRDALESLVGGGAVDDTVRPEIGSSWQRSIESGLKPERLDVPFEADVDTDNLLVRAARPVLEQLAEDLADTSAAILLTDSRGLVEGRWVAQRSLRRGLDDISLALGFVYDEPSVGTNAIGTALAQHAPSRVTGPEHFSEALVQMTCGAAPITDPGTGQLIGAIDLTCFAGETAPFLLPLARYARHGIEDRLVDDMRTSERVLLQHFLRLRRGAKGPVVLVSEGRMFANAAADRFVSQADAPELWDVAQKLSLTSGPEWLPVVVGGRRLLATSEPVVDGGVLLGFAVRLLPEGEAAAPLLSLGAPGLELLTQTEQSVAELAAQGLTNREIGERLFMSRFTVDTHLRSIFRKLGVRSRVELTRRVAGATA